MFFILDHVDNPVYLFQNGRKDNEQLLNNTTKIHNNLHKANNTNLEKNRLGIPCCSTDDDDLAKGIYDPGVDELSRLKNKDADATNPNIYHSLDKLDHVYAEIKQKDIGKYCHL